MTNHRNPEDLANPDLQRALEFHLSQFLKAIMQDGLVEETDRTPFESLVANVIRMSLHVADGSVEDSDYRRLTAAVVDRWERGLGDRSAAFSLIRVVLNTDVTVPEDVRQNVASAGTIFIMRDGSRTPDDFMAKHSLLNLIEEEPDLFKSFTTENYSREMLLEEIEEFIQEEADRILSEEELHEARSTVESWDEVLYEFGLVDSGYLDDLWGAVEQAEQDSAGPDDDGGDYRLHGNDESHGDIDILFSSLAEK